MFGSIQRVSRNLAQKKITVRFVRKRLVLNFNANCDYEVSDAKDRNVC